MKQPLIAFVRFVKEVTLVHDECIGFFTVKDFIKISMVNRKLNRLVIKHKLVKKLVRFGNLDNQIRLKFWIKLSPFFEIQEALREEL